MVTRFYRWTLVTGTHASLSGPQHHGTSCRRFGASCEALWCRGSDISMTAMYCGSDERIFFHDSPLDVLWVNWSQALEYKTQTFEHSDKNYMVSDVKEHHSRLSGSINRPMLKLVVFLYILAADLEMWQQVHKTNNDSYTTVVFRFRDLQAMFCRLRDAIIRVLSI